MERAEEGHVYKVQWPVYYISKVLLESKAKNPHVQKLLYALLITSRKLRHYFDEHKLTWYPTSHLAMSYAIGMQ